MKCDSSSLTTFEIELLKVFLNLHRLDKMKYFGHVKFERVFATLMPETFFRMLYFLWQTKRY